jgi:hypothetical protein
VFFCLEIELLRRGVEKIARRIEEIFFPKRAEPYCTGTVATVGFQKFVRLSARATTTPSILKSNTFFDSISLHQYELF